MLLSALVLLTGFTFINRCYRFSGKTLPVAPDDFTIMSYNVRVFNLYEWIPRKDIALSIASFVKEKDPDILCMQEYTSKGDTLFKQYKYKYTFKEDGKTGHGVYSKFPIVGHGDLNFANTGNSAIYTDIVKGKDTVRVYSMHMQSVKISPDIHESIDEQKSKVIFMRLSEAFKKQQEQATILAAHKAECPYTTIVCGDLNNSAFSYVYRKIKGDMQDAFEEAGRGFGKSYNYRYYPARIDYILEDKNLQVKEFKTFNNFVNSDHYPIMARLAFSKPEKKE